MKKFHFRLWLLRWHRRIGLILSIFLLWMIGTGILLNHEQLFGWDKKTLSSSFWLNWYGVSADKSLFINNKKLTLNQDGLWLEQQNLGECAVLLGLVKQPQQTIIACSQQLWLLTNDGEVIDQVDRLRGLTQYFDALSLQSDPVLLRSEDGIVRLNTEDLSLTPVSAADRAVTWQEPMQPNAQITEERWLLDAHSGRLFGQWGTWLVDIFAISLLVLVISGWMLARKRRF